MPLLPSGTVTFVFTDIEGSTRLIQGLGDVTSEQIFADYRRLLGEAVKTAGGDVYQDQGESFLFVFPRAKDAVLAAVAAQRALTRHAWPNGATVRVRMGLHTGEPASAHGAYVGLDVHRAARISAAAHGGQILLSQVTRELIEEDLPDGVILRDLGEHRLKDLSRPQRLFQVVTPELPAGFPPLQTFDSLPNNLPRQLTSFIGREREIAEIEDLLAKSFLVTLTGAGGSGKTRLALQVAAERLDQYLDGVWWVELASLSEPALIPQALATALSVREQPGRPLMETLLDYLRPKTLLLLLDNAEHLLSPCASLADALLRRCPNLRILVTSREAVRIEGESSYPVSPLSLPSPGMLPPAVTLTQYEAVRLFIDRATAARPSFRTTEQNAAAVVQICRRVDGIPLALELAAARVKALSVDQIASRLDDQFRVLTNGSRTGLQRHQTLRATIDWSFDLLTEGETVLFQRLAVFAGGFILEAAETVCSGAGVEASDIMGLLTHLVEKSLIVAEDRGAEVRYRLLEPVRQYALDKLLEAGESPAIRARHRDFFLALAESGYVGLAGAGAQMWLARIEAEHDNVRTALRWSLDAQDLEVAAHLGAAMSRFWARRRLLNEGWGWLQELRKHEERLSRALRARVLSGVGLLAFEIGEPAGTAQARPTEEALTLYQQLGDRLGIEICIRLLGMVETERGNYERAGSLQDEAIALARERGDAVEEAEAVRQRGYTAAKQGDYALATRALEKSLALARQVGTQRSVGFALGHLAQVYHYLGQSDRAIPMLQEALAILQAVQHGTGTAYFLNVLGLVRLAVGDHDGAETAYRECLTFAREIGYKWAIAQSLIGFGALCAARGHRETAVRLLAAADAMLTMIEYAIPSAEQAYFEHAVEALRRGMDPRNFARIWTEGRAITVEQAIECALSMDS